MWTERQNRRACFSPITLLMVIFMILAVTQGCAAAIGVGATVGTATAQERGLGQAVDDTQIHAGILASWLEHKPDFLRKLDVTVIEGDVLLTGSLSSSENHLEAVRLTWATDGVKRVIDEIQITDENGITDLISDSWITSQLLSSLTLDKNIYSINYNVETVNQIVYLFGIAQNQEEINRVIRHAKNISGVKRVINHIRKKSSPEN